MRAGGGRGGGGGRRVPLGRSHVVCVQACWARYRLRCALACKRCMLSVGCSWQQLLLSGAPAACFAACACTCVGPSAHLPLPLRRPLLAGTTRSGGSCAMPSCKQRQRTMRLSAGRRQPPLWQPSAAAPCHWRAQRRRLPQPWPPPPHLAVSWRSDSGGAAAPSTSRGPLCLQRACWRAGCCTIGPRLGMPAGGTPCPFTTETASGCCASVPDRLGCTN